MKFIKLLFIFIFFMQIFRIFYVNLNKNIMLEKYRNNQYYIEKKNIRYRLPIVDRNNKVLAETEATFSLYCIPKELSEESINFIKENFIDCYEKILNKKNSFKFLYIKRNLDENSIKKIIDKNLSDIYFLKEFKRVYPYEFLTNIIGLVDVDLNGTAGLEFFMNKEIKRSQEKEKIDIFSVKPYIDNFYKNNTDNLKITIDSNLSSQINYIIKKCCDENISKYVIAIIMDGKNGEILALNQYPYYKPNFKDESLLKSFAVTDEYEVGSVIKAFSALAAIEEKVVKNDELIDCENTKNTFINRIPVSTWKAHGIISFEDVIRGSNNIGTSKVALRLGTKLYDNYKKLGFGRKTNIELPGEVSGFINNPNNWSGQSLISLSFGYEISASILQLIKAWSVFSNNGILLNPTIIYGKNKNNNEKIYSDESINIMRNILKYNKERIPREYKKILDNVDFFAKTGTARLIEDGKYIENKNSYTCVGHIENKNYSRIIAVYIRESCRAKEKGFYAASIALPLLLDIAQLLIINEK